MRLRKAGGQEEGTVSVRLQVLDRARGGSMIPVRFSLPLEHDMAVGVCRAGWSTPTPGSSCTGELPRLTALGPGRGVVHAAVEDLAGAQRRIPALFEILRQRHDIRVRHAKPGIVVQHTGRGRVPAGQE